MPTPLVNEQYLRIEPDGEIYLADVRYTRKELSKTIADKLAKDITRTIANFTQLDGLRVGIAMTANEVFIGVRLNRLNIHTTYNVGSVDKLLHPRFAVKRSTDASELPFLPATWTVPPTMNLMFAARIHSHGTCEPYSDPNQSCYLIAYDNRRAAYKLPMGNLYADCSVCMGDFNGEAENSIGAFLKAYQQLCKSDWNGDLMERQDMADKLFSFKLTADSTECVPFNGDWAPLCEKVATPVTNIIGAIAIS
jgi:hypothetical protein